jgi:hypothetical protein
MLNLTSHWQEKHKHRMTVSISHQAYCTNILEQFFLLATVKGAPFYLTLLGRFSLFILPRSKGVSKFSISGIFQ